MKVLLFPFKLLWSLFVFLVPLTGIWVASSLAAFYNGPTWVLVGAGALLFPILPLLWEWRAHTKFVKKHKDAKEPKKRFLTFWDRMVLRTLLLNIVFLGGLLATFPQAGFTAISTRGDWMLQNQQTGQAKLVRKVLFGSAQGLEWLYTATQDNPYEKYADDDDKTPTPKPNPQPVPSSDPKKPDNKDPDTKKPDVKKPDTQKPDSNPEPTGGKNAKWRMRATLHPLVASMPSSSERSIESVAKYLAKEQDPTQRVKALHDYVADRIAYDAPALARGDYPPQDAETVFRTKKAVCAGYAKLLVALGKITGDEIVYVVGVSRDLGGNVGGAGHAWNAAKIEGLWYLIDATWNSGHVKGTKFTKSYGTNYLFTPPAVFGIDHFPKKKAWQLRKNPISRGEFMRQPVLKPAFYASRLSLISPTRSQVSVEDSVEIILGNPRQNKILAKLVPKGSKQKLDVCKVRSEGNKTRINCKMPGKGTYQVYIFSAQGKQRMYPFVGQIEVNASGR